MKVATKPEGKGARKMITLQDVLAAVGVVFNGIPMMIFAMSYGFMAAPTAIGYMIGAGGMLAFGTVTPISIQAGTIALVGTMGRTLRERISISAFSGIIMAVVGMFGLVHTVMEFAGARVVFGMQAGVGIILAKVALGMIKSDRFVGLISLAVAIAVYLPTLDLVYTVVASVAVSSAAYFFRNKERPEEVHTERYKLTFYKPEFNYNVVRGALALACLTVGSNIAFGNITAGMSGTTADIDALTIYSGLANVAAFVGAAPVETIISATGAAPNPAASGIIMMLMMAVILLTGTLTKLAKFVPMQSIAGFLFVIGAFATVPGNAMNAFNGAERAEQLGASFALLVTALTDPFLGLLVGTIVRLLTPIFSL